MISWGVRGGRYGEGETSAVGQMDSFKDITNLCAATDERDDPGIGDVDTLDQPYPLQLFQRVPDFHTRSVRDPHTRRQIQVPQPRTMSRQLRNPPIRNLETMSQMQVMQILAQGNEGNDPPVRQGRTFIQDHVPESRGVCHDGNQIRVCEGDALRQIEDAQLWPVLLGEAGDQNVGEERFTAAEPEFPKEREEAGG